MLAVVFVIAIVAGPFMATNLDNLVRLVALFRRYGDHRYEVAFGYLAGILIVIAATLFTQLDNSTDTIITCVVLFSDSNDLGDHLVLASFAGMALLFVLVAYRALRHPWLNRPIQHYGHYITPLILITVGMYVLSNTGLDLLPGT